jgi:hypothetical protein
MDIVGSRKAKPTFAFKEKFHLKNNNSIVRYLFILPWLKLQHIQRCMDPLINAKLVFLLVCQMLDDSKNRKHPEGELVALQ